MTSSQQNVLHLGDTELLNMSMKVLGKLEFLSSASRGLLEQLPDRDEAKKSQSDFLSACPEIDDLWTELVIDAVHALKIRDRREKARQQNFHQKGEAEQQRARYQNVFGITELKSYFEDFGRFESVLYGIDGAYRDHVAHVIRVWLTGICLLSLEQKDGNAAVDSLRLNFSTYGGVGRRAKVRRHTEEISRDERWAMWTVIALCHDLGYPLEEARKVNDAIDRMLLHFGDVSTTRYSYSFHSQNQLLNEATLNVLSSKVEMIKSPKGRDEMETAASGVYTTSIQAKFYAKFAHSLEEFQHGIISCLVLMKTLVYFMETDCDRTGRGSLCLEDARQFSIRNEILRAIASHTCTDIYHLRLSTFAFMLIVCDELQEWGRPTFREMKLGRGHSSGANNIEIHECDFSKGVFSARLIYKKDEGPERDKVISKFEMFHKLLRAALDDSGRKVSFRWEIRSNSVYLFEYDSNRPAFEELTVSEDGKPITADLYRRPQRESNGKTEAVGLVK